MDGGLVKLFQELGLVFVDDDRSRHTPMAVATEFGANDWVARWVSRALNADGREANLGLTATPCRIAGQQILLDAHRRHPVGMDDILGLQIQIDILANVGVQSVRAVDDDGVAIGIKAASLVGVRPGITGAADIDLDRFPVDHVDGRLRLRVLRPNVEADHREEDDNESRYDRPDDLQQGIAMISWPIALIAFAGAEENNRDQEQALDQEKDDAADDNQDVKKLVDALGFRRCLRRQNYRHKGREPVDADNADQQEYGGDHNRCRANRRDIGTTVIHMGLPPTVHGHQTCALKV